MRANFSAEYFAFFTIFAQNPVACAELPHSCLPLDSSAFQPITPRFPSMQKRSPPHKPTIITSVSTLSVRGPAMSVSTLRVFIWTRLIPLTGMITSSQNFVVGLLAEWRHIPFRHRLDDVCTSFQRIGLRCCVTSGDVPVTLRHG